MIIQSASKPFIVEPKSVYKKNIPIKKFDLNHLSNIDNLWKKLFRVKRKSFKKKKSAKNIIITNINSDELRLRIYHLNQKSQMKILKYNTIIHASVESYLRMGRYIGKLISLAEYYFPIFEEKFDSFYLPKELKYIAIIESNLNPKITSKVGAKGIWQFMNETGKTYHLNVNRFYDERNDPIKSTEAACKYFKYLYKKIGNWELVLAAYNAGPGKIDQIIQNNKGKKDFWGLLDSLPRETRNYIPKFIAINYVMNYYKEHNIIPFHQHHHLKYRDTILVPIKGKVSLKYLSSLLKIPYKDLIFLNPQYLVDVISPGENIFIRLPKIKSLILRERGKEGFFSRKKINY
ncbi:lytic transglycosylase domain-containing protein [Blattabacterium cuenoti]|uniref:lytic transglycosylase domain-containing protein n=1 Tax=Blattabacterium cuenoti TaxID=1653831 RepID=UPI001EEC01A8|nr:lytic transglycosylase domain-containing protein [Blattabacterium cuenoti]